MKNVVGEMELIVGGVHGIIGLRLGMRVLQGSVHIIIFGHLASEFVQESAALVGTGKQDRLLLHPAQQSADRCRAIDGPLR